MQYDFYTAPPDYPSYVKKLRELKRDFPFLQIFSIGQSLLGRQIYAISLGVSNPCTLMAGAFHAQEWLTCTLLVRFLEHLSLSYRQNTAIAGSLVADSLSARGVVFVPLVNPDGVQIALYGPDTAGALASTVEKIQARSPKSWQANARGVDLNHNFDAGFDILREMETESGITLPFPRQYGGAFPHSEPETRALVSFLRGRRVETLYAFHSQGEEIYSEYGCHTPAQSKYIAKLLCEASGYTPVANDGLCSHGGCKDYFIEKYHRPGFTIEIGKGENPLPIESLEDIYERTLEMMLIAAVI